MLRTVALIYYIYRYRLVSYTLENKDFKRYYSHIFHLPSYSRNLDEYGLWPPQMEQGPLTWNGTRVSNKLLN